MRANLGENLDSNEMSMDLGCRSGKFAAAFALSVSRIAHPVRLPPSSDTRQLTGPRQVADGERKHDIRPTAQNQRDPHCQANEPEP
jgi:hypothetical protein